eukprot:TRINITY_DN6175_c0_g1_i1.p1 TRINITY_DN6175_c0_g1~~TRINITY_DN6175_c0_g1_i1.p1  ORF type:complete len:120 (-),score=12.62 TRINITY_DN6175_c0_g1_i1:101-460(-)
MASLDCRQILSFEQRKYDSLGFPLCNNPWPARSSNIADRSFQGNVVGRWKWTYNPSWNFSQRKIQIPFPDLLECGLTTPFDEPRDWMVTIFREGGASCSASLTVTVEDGCKYSISDFES